MEKLDINQKNNQNEWVKHEYQIEEVYCDPITNEVLDIPKRYQEIKIQDSNEFIQLSIDIGIKNEALRNMALSLNSNQYIRKQLILK